MLRQLRTMFATICIYCQPSDPLMLWTTHEDALIEDFFGTNDHDEAMNQALHDFEKILPENGSSCAAIGLPSPQGEIGDDLFSPHKPAPCFDDLTDE